MWQDLIGKLEGSAAVDCDPREEQQTMEIGQCRKEEGVCQDCRRGFRYCPPRGTGCHGIPLG
jgi:hypothetical protein